MSKQSNILATWTMTGKRISSTDEIAERNRQILRDWNVGRMTTQAIADRYSVSKGTVSGVIFRARRDNQPAPRRQRSGPRRKRSDELLKARQTRKAEIEIARTWQPLSPEMTLLMGDAIVQLEFGQCRFPIDGEGKFFFCQDLAQPGKVYCEFHHDLCHRNISDDQSES